MPHTIKDLSPLLTAFAREFAAEPATPPDHTELVNDIKRAAQWDGLTLPNQRESALAALCDRMAPGLDPPTYEHAKNALWTALMPPGEMPEYVKFRVGGADFQLLRTLVGERGGRVLGRYAEPGYAEARKLGTHTLQLGWHMTQETFVHIANFIGDGVLPSGLPEWERNKLQYAADRLGMPALDGALDPLTKKLTRDLLQRRINILHDFHAEMTDVDAAWLNLTDAITLDHALEDRPYVSLAMWGATYNCHALINMRRGLRTGTELHVKGFGLKSLPEQLFWLRRVEILNLANNELAVIPDELGALTTLKCLMLWSNKLSRLPSTAKQLTALTDLDLSSNVGFSEISPDIVKLPNLCTLYVDNNRLTDFPECAFSSQQLTALSLAGNQLTRVPASIVGAVGLRELNLGKNKVGALPDAIGALTNLIDLDLSQNELTLLPDSVANWVNLVSLNLNQNQLVALPDGVAHMLALKNLSADDNRIVDLPANLGQAQRLTHLSVNNNRLTALTASLGSAPSLTLIEVNENQISRVAQEVFMAPALTQLSLHTNHLVNLPEMGTPPNLQILNVAKNLLVTLPESICAAPRLEEINASNNQLSSLPLSLMESQSIEKLVVDNNPILQIRLDPRMNNFIPYRSFCYLGTPSTSHYCDLSASGTPSREFGHQEPPTATEPLRREKGNQMSALRKFVLVARHKRRKMTRQA